MRLKREEKQKLLDKLNQEKIEKERIRLEEKRRQEEEKKKMEEEKLKEKKKLEEEKRKQEEEKRKIAEEKQREIDEKRRKEEKVKNQFASFFIKKDPSSCDKVSHLKNYLIQLNTLNYYCQIS